MMKQIEILNIPIISDTKKEFLQFIQSELISNKFHQISTVNAEFIVRSNENKQFQELLKNKTLNTPDGISIRAAAYYLSLKKPKNILLRILVSLIQGIFTGILIVFNKKAFTQLPELISGSDLFWDIIKIANETKKSIYILGSTQKNLEIINKKIIKKYPNLKISGYSNADAYDPSLPKSIADTHPDILLVGFGSPKQEFFIDKNKILINFKLAIGLGGTFEFVSNSIRRAPNGFKNLGLEWLWRAILQPSRIKRIYKAVIVFSYLIFLYSINHVSDEG